MNALQLALTVQLALYVVAIIAVIVATVRAVKLHRQSGGKPGWWESEAARSGIGYAVKPLWLTAIALLLGAFAPRLLGAIGG